MMIDLPAGMTIGEFIEKHGREAAEEIFCHALHGVMTSLLAKFEMTNQIEFAAILFPGPEAAPGLLNGEHFIARYVGSCDHIKGAMVMQSFVNSIAEELGEWEGAKGKGKLN